MILRSQGFVLRHRDGLYMVTLWNRAEQVVSFAVTESPLTASIAYNREKAFAFLKEPDWACVADQWEVVDYPCCACCGYHFKLVWVAPDDYRCEKHLGRNPCAIEGCQRSTGAGSGYERDVWLCSEHWRRYVPPRSPARRAYLRLHRQGKRHGWSIEMRRRYWRFWHGLVKRAQRQSQAGRFDMTEVNKLFGWDET